MEVREFIKFLEFKQQEFREIRWGNIDRLKGFLKECSDLCCSEFELNTLIEHFQGIVIEEKYNIKRIGV